MEGQPRRGVALSKNERMMLTPLRTMFSRVRRETGVRENLWKRATGNWGLQCNRRSSAHLRTMFFW